MTSPRIDALSGAARGSRLRRGAVPALLLWFAGSVPAQVHQHPARLIGTESISDTVDAFAQGFPMESHRCPVPHCSSTYRLAIREEFFHDEDPSYVINDELVWNDQTLLKRYYLCECGHFYVECLDDESHYGDGSVENRGACAVCEGEEIRSEP